MSVETHRVLMGACGWNHQAWLNDFYSDDLPEDWRLGFYSNEFPVIYVPAADWLDVINSDAMDSDSEDLSEWTEDVADSFRFILEIPADILENEERFTAALDKVKKLGDFCLGLVLQLNPSICNDSDLFQQCIDRAIAIAPICIDRQGNILSDELQKVLVNRNISEVWDGKSIETESCKRGSLAISHISSDELNMAALRKVIEHCLTTSNEERISVLCIDGNPPSLELLRNADVILNLL